VHRTTKRPEQGTVPVSEPLNMRFHKSKKVSAPDAERIMETASSSLNEHVVIAHNDDWYDVRLMTSSELQDFVADLLRAEASVIEAGLIRLH
jgi:hypothetical protein